MTDEELENLEAHIEMWTYKMGTPRAHFSKDDFHRVILYSDWCNLDYWNGSKIQSGMYEVKWPNGLQATETVMVKHWIEDPHARDGDIPCSKAYILADHNGQTVEVPVRGLFLKKL